MKTVRPLLSWGVRTTYIYLYVFREFLTSTCVLNAFSGMYSGANRNVLCRLEIVLHDGIKYILLQFKDLKEFES